MGGMTLRDSGNIHLSFLPDIDVHTYEYICIYLLYLYFMYQLGVHFIDETSINSNFYNLIVILDQSQDKLSHH